MFKALESSSTSILFLCKQGRRLQVCLSAPASLRVCCFMRCSRGGGGGGAGGLKNHKIIGFLSNTGSDPLKSCQASIQYWAIISTAFRWQADDGLLIVVFGSSLPSSTKTPSKFDFLWQNFLDPRMCLIKYVNLTWWFCLFDLILYVPSTIFQLNRDGSSWVEPVLS